VVDTLLYLCITYSVECDGRDEMSEVLACDYCGKFPARTVEHPILDDIMIDLCKSCQMCLEKTKVDMRRRRNGKDSPIRGPVPR